MKYIEKAIAHLAAENERLKEELKSSEETNDRTFRWWQDEKKKNESLNKKEK